MAISILENEFLKIKFNSFGAEMQSLFYKKIDEKFGKTGIECLWQADDKFWGRHAPVLFPIVGRLKDDKLVHQGKPYPMTQHGFARDSEFNMTKNSDSMIQFTLTANQKTLKQFPFDFELFIEYQLQDNNLITSYIIKNSDNTILPASIGAHPAFNWPLIQNIPKTDHYINFEFNESEPIRQLDNGLLLNEKFPNPANDKKILLKDSLFNNDALIFDQLKSRKLTYSAGNKFSITMHYDDFPHYGIWTKPDAPFICLEPWQGHSSAIDFNGEFLDKPGVLLIPEHSEIRKSFKISIN